MSDPDNTPKLPLVVGVSTRAMFDLEEEHAVFENDGVHAYIELQRARECEPLRPGAAFESRMSWVNDLASVFGIAAGAIRPTVEAQRG